MISRRHRDRPTEHELAALADGSLAPARRARVERVVDASPDLQADLREQRQALAAVRAVADERAPAALRARVAMPRKAARPARRIGALAVAGTATLALAVVLTLGGGPARAPSVADAAVLATRPPAAPAPEALRGAATLPSPRGAGLPFPNWEEKFGWKATGVRHDRLAGRAATTVFYRRGSEAVAYTIVGGGPLPVGSHTPASGRGGTEFLGFAAHGRHGVTWLRRGHTCVLSATSTSEAALFRLAAWRGQGELPY
jgi:hypothetical protein